MRRLALVVVASLLVSLVCVTAATGDDSVIYLPAVSKAPTATASWTPQPTYTLLPTYTPYPTNTPYPTVTATPTQPPVTNLIVNGDFEQGATGWSGSDNIENYNFIAWHSGSWGAYLGDLGEEAEVSQRVRIPQGATSIRLGYWMQWTGLETISGFDYFAVYLWPVGGSDFLLWEYRGAPRDYAHQWTYVEHVVSVNPGMQIDVVFKTDNSYINRSWALIDDVKLEVVH